MHKPWYESWPTGIPRSFSEDQARSNASYLIEKVGSWISRPPGGTKRHPLAEAWQQMGPDAYLRLNRFAEDLRILEGVPGLSGVLKDIRTPKRFEPTLHELHTAALFQRGGHPVTKFYAPLNDSVPDFDFDLDGRVLVEAKQLTTSGAAALFSSRSWQLQEGLVQALQKDRPEFPEVEILVVVKDAKKVPPSVAEVAAQIHDGLSILLSGPHMYRSDEYNLLARPLPPSATFDRRLTLHVVSPTLAIEDERVERLVKKANRQLRDNADGKCPGITCVALRSEQDPVAVQELIKRKFDDNQYRSTSAVLLHRYASFQNPRQHAIADALMWIRNDNAHVPIDKSINLKGPELTGPLADLPVDQSVSCYSISSAHGRVKNVSIDGGIGVSPIYRLQPDLLV